jgi:hypothetical protein
MHRRPAMFPSRGSWVPRYLGRRVPSPESDPAPYLPHIQLEPEQLFAVTFQGFVGLMNSDVTVADKHLFIDARA